MSESVKCNISELELYKKDIIKYYEEQVSHFKNINHKFKNVVWNDQKLEERINEINNCLTKIADAINNITDGHHIVIIDTFLEEANDYLNTCLHYPK